MRLQLFTCILALALLAFFPSPVSAHGGQQVVSVTSDGFYPDHVKVHVGDSVVWVNHGKKQHWPASDVHPTHTVYPGTDIGKCFSAGQGKLLDSCKGLKTGEEFKFAFNEIGTWGVHDHLLPGNTMTIEAVAEPGALEGDPAQKHPGIAFIEAFFGNLFKKVTAYFSLANLFLPAAPPEAIAFPEKSEFKALSYQEQQGVMKKLAASDPERAWKFLVEAFKVNGVVRENPHELAHIAGNALYAKLGIKGVKACDPSFAFGCYHGVTEKMLLEKGVDALKEIEAACVGLFEGGDALTASCIHGTGHGLLAWEELGVGAALVDCDLLGERHRGFCYDGVFMEYSATAPAPVKDWSFCSSVSEKYHYECAKYHIYSLGKAVNWDFKAMASSCEAAPSQVLKTSCFAGLGFFAANSGLGSIEGVKNVCGTASTSEGRAVCVIHAAIEVIFQEYNDWPATSKELCESLGGTYRQECVERTTAIIKAYNRDPLSSVSSSQGLQGLSPEIQEIKSLTNLDEQVRVYRRLIERVGPAEAQEQLYHSGLPFTGQTHLLNHAVGEYLFNEFGAQGLAQCKEYFLASCYHGFTILAIGRSGVEGMDEIARECQKLGLSVTSQCSHAFGHGFLAWVGYENFTKALDLCNEMTARVEGFPGFNCRDGVFMENIWGVHDGKPAEDRWVKEGDLFYPCNDPRIDAKDLDGCWANQPSLMYQMLKGDLKRVGELCLQVEPENLKRTCFNALARQIHPLTKGEKKLAFEQCALLPKDWVDYCLDVVTISDFSVGGRKLSFEICSSVREEAKQSCYQGLFGAMSVYAGTQDEFNGFCSLVTEEPWKANCVNSYRPSTLSPVKAAP